MDGWIKLLAPKQTNKQTKKIEKILFSDEVQCINNKKTQIKTLVRDLHAADFSYHLDCWLGVTVKYRPAGLVQL